MELGKYVGVEEQAHVAQVGPKFESSALKDRQSARSPSSDQVDTALGFGLLDFLWEKASGYVLSLGF